MGKSAPQVDNSGVVQAQASAKAADNQYKLGEDQLAWAKQQWGDQQKYYDQIIPGQIAAQDKANQFASDQYDMWKSTYQPLQEKFAQEAQNWASPEQLAVNAGQASGDVASSMDAQKQTSLAQLESYGVDPTSTRYAALDTGYGAVTGAAQAAAGTGAIQNTKLQGLSLEGQAIGQGMNAPGAVASLTGAGSGAAGAATQGLSTNLMTGANAMTSGTAFTNAGSNAMGIYTNAVNGFNQAQAQQYQAEQAGMAGWGSALGSAAAVAAFKWADGGPVDDATTGGPVPTSMSPSQGMATDDVNAKLNAGEFVMPKDTVSWLGQKHFVDLIDKARKAQHELSQRSDIGGEPAGPQQGMPVARPNFASRGQAMPVPQGMPMQRAA